MNQYFLPLDVAFRKMALSDVSQSRDFAQSSIAASTACLANAGNQVAFIRMGSSGVNATVGDFPVLPGQTVFLNRPPSHVCLGAVCSSGASTTLYMGLGYNG